MHRLSRAPLLLPPQLRRRLLAAAGASTTTGAAKLDSLQSLGLTDRLNFVNGERCDGAGPAFDNVYPASGHRTARLRQSTPGDIDQAVLAAKEAYVQWRDTSPLERSLKLSEAARLVRSRHDLLATVEVLDTGKPIWEARADIEACADTLQMFAGLTHTLAGEHVHLPGGSFYYTRREPFGVCAGIGAWNYPFQMAVWKSAPALACGNSLVFKPAPLTPLGAVQLAEIYAEAGLPRGLFTVVQGGADTGQALVQHPDIAKVSFTGSVAGGQAVAAAAGRLVRPVTLELGGKSPLIIFADADLDEAVKGAVLANYLCQGQVCSNAARVFVERKIAADFTDRLLRAVAGLRVGDPMLADTAIGASITAEHTAKVQDYVASAESEGAKRLYGGDRVSVPGLEAGNFLRPCVLANCTDGMRAVREEIFGPVLTLLTFDSEAEAVGRANATEFGLSGGVFTRDLARAHRVIGSLHAGSLYINTYNSYPPGVPFGGYKQSGFGRENCAESLHSYSQVKSVYVECGGIQLPTVP